MRSIILFAAIVFVGSSDAMSQFVTPDQLTRTGLVVNHRVEEYFDEVYTTKPRETFVFFQGEPITYRVAVHNVGAAASALVVGSTDPQQLLSVKAMKAPPLSPQNIDLPRPVSNDRYLDEVDVMVPLVVSAPIRKWAGGEFSIPWERETTLEPGHSVEWVVDLPTDLVPGLYRIEVRVNGTERGGQPLKSFARLGFEVRASTQDAKPEVLRRQAMRFLAKEDYFLAREATAALLQVHPNSAVGREILAVIATREGRIAEATAHRQDATAIRNTRRDELLLKYEPKGTLR